MKKKICKECKKEFVYKPGRYERKYCDVCGKKRKKLWDNQWKVKFEDFEDEEE